MSIDQMNHERSDEWLHGYTHGMTPRRVFDPDHRYTGTQKLEYYAGYRCGQDELLRLTKGPTNETH